MTHNDLIDRAEKWLRNSLRCRVVFTELVAYTRSLEIPDVIGFRHTETIVVEAKVSKRDFYADRKKPSRNWQRPAALYPALGDWRFYLTAPGLLDGLELPPGWGWYEVHGRSVRYKAGSRYRRYQHIVAKRPCQSDWYSERAMLISALARGNAGRRMEASQRKLW